MICVEGRDYGLGMSDLSTQIEEEAAKPKAAQSADASVTRRDLRELIEADRYLASKAAMSKKPQRGLTLTKLSPPGTT